MAGALGGSSVTLCASCCEVKSTTEYVPLCDGLSKAITADPMKKCAWKIAPYNTVVLTPSNKDFQVPETHVLPLLPKLYVEVQIHYGGKVQIAGAWSS